MASLSNNGLISDIDYNQTHQTIQLGQSQ